MTYSNLFSLSFYFSVGITYIYIEQVKFETVQEQCGFVIYTIVPILYMSIYYAYAQQNNISSSIDSEIIGYFGGNHSMPDAIQKRADSITLERSTSYELRANDSVDTKEICVICLDEFDNNELVIDTCSGHTFHSECLKKHFETSYERKVTMRPNTAMEPFVFHCPLCKRQLEL